MSRKMSSELYRRAITTWGEEAQRWMVVEEISEFLDTLAKAIRGRASRQELVDELADAQIMLEQIMILFSLSENEVEEAKRRKLERLESRLVGDLTCRT